MDHQDAALAIILLAVFIGLYSGIHGWKLPETDKLEFNSDNGTGGEGYELGSAHEHAMFYVIYNGSELKFREPRYQLAAKHVHLENNKSHIVHKHAEGVKWSDFFETIDLEVRRGENTCIELKNISKCGGEVNLNGEKADLSSEIKQGDRMIVVLDENPEPVIRNYSKKQLPRIYKPQASRGRRL